jgi:hypothetical protein
VAAIQPAPSGAISDRGAMGAARRLRFLSAALSGGLALLIAASALAFGSVHPWAEAPLLYATAFLTILALARAATVLQLRRLLGRSRFAFHSSGRWLVLDVEEPYGLRTWSYDLDRPIVPRPPLLLPGLLFAAWVGVQMFPLPPAVADRLAGGATLPGGEVETDWRPLSVSLADTAAGLGWLAWTLILHVVAASALSGREAEQRFRRFVAVFGLVLGILGLAQMATRTRLVYWFFKPWEGTGEHIFGPFVSRDHFAFYMVMVAPIALGLFAQAFRRYRARVGGHANLRRWAVTASSPEGLSMVYWTIPALAAVGSLFATTSRGGFLAFGGGLVLAAVALSRRRGVPAWLSAAVLTLVALSWFGIDRIESRMRRVAVDSPGRTIVWADALDRMEGRWVGGSGFNTFAMAMSRSTAWALPVGATPWREPYETTIVDVVHAGFRTPVGIPGLWYYREAHNDYIQVLAETGAVGLLLALWAAGRVLISARADPWLLAALGGALMHSFVDFGLHVPAVVALFVALAAIRPEEKRR